MATSTLRDKILETVQGLPDDATVEDAMERLYFLANVERGVEQADRDEGVSHDEIKKRFLQ